MEQQGSRRAFHYRWTGNTVAGTQLFHVDFCGLDEVLEINLPLADARSVRILPFQFLFLQLWLIRLRRRRDNKIAKNNAGPSVSRPFCRRFFHRLLRNSP